MKTVDCILLIYVFIVGGENVTKMRRINANKKNENKTCVCIEFTECNTLKKNSMSFSSSSC